MPIRFRGSLDFDQTAMKNASPLPASNTDCDGYTPRNESSRPPSRYLRGNPGGGTPVRRVRSLVSRDDEELIALNAPWPGANLRNKSVRMSAIKIYDQKSPCSTITVDIPQALLQNFSVGAMTWSCYRSPVEPGLMGCGSPTPHQLNTMAWKTSSPRRGIVIWSFATARMTLGRCQRTQHRQRSTGGQPLAATTRRRPRVITDLNSKPLWSAIRLRVRNCGRCSRHETARYN